MNRPSQKILLFLFFPLFLFIPLFSQGADLHSFTGKVVGIPHGDTIKALRAGRAVKVRLHGIDCPEKKQPYGTRVKQYTSDLLVDATG